ncbi:MAG: hypothetical protein ACK40I_05490 [Tabrizicola sp.]
MWPTTATGSSSCEPGARPDYLLSVAQDDALHAVTVRADDGMILEAMVRLAEGSGLMPRLGFRR